MPVTDGIVTALERNWDMVDRALAGMDYETMARRPNDSSNSVAWILWHMNRVWDALINTMLSDGVQLWERGGWQERYGMADRDPADRGVGWTAEEVAAWQPPAVEVQLGYYQALRGRNPRVPSRPDPGRAGKDDPDSAHDRTSYRRRGPGPAHLGQRGSRRPNRLPARLLPGHGLESEIVAS